MQAKLSILLALSSSLSLTAAEDVLGVYIFHRHGDRTAKAWKPVNFTALGAEQVYSSGSYYRGRYVTAGADFKISGLSSDTAVLSQIEVTAPVDAVLQNSALVFLQGLYPPTGHVETLANGSRVEAPLDGYQYIPVNSIESAASAKDSENSAWLQGNSGCNNAEVSSNDYFTSSEYAKTYDGSKSFYSGLLPVVNGTFSKDEATFKNGYTIFDLINVATIHNSSIPSDDLLNESTLDKLYNLASIHEWNLAYNSSTPVRSIAGAVLAGQILEALEPLAKGEKGNAKFNIQFGAYGTFMAFFGLAQLHKADSDFMGVCNYASSMTFELVTNATKPTADDVSVRFYFSNGTAAEEEPKLFPLFNQEKTTLSWADFKSGMSDFAIEDDQHWCKLCGNTDGLCASNSTSTTSDDDSSSQSSSGSGSGISKPVAGVIGALVTLAVILGLQAAFLLLGGFRLVKKARLAPSSSAAGGVKA
ncbi:histidine phosphatase superfamily [Thelonectria olida]|uniref:Histidine phosphatase superfamily n=1 Tax=Thelonectria olida TaxID=1576542 RepID=A0A9P9AVR7_9HYPO|nr:histidine phosphatase superfamily [Thelonectria olida]